MQATRRAGGGTRANSASLKVAFTHQQTACGPVPLGCAMAQALGPPHKGQRQGSGGGQASMAQV
jgi:hypothetical protein